MQTLQHVLLDCPALEEHRVRVRDAIARARRFGVGGEALETAPYCDLGKEAEMEGILLMAHRAFSPSNFDPFLRDKNLKQHEVAPHLAALSLLHSIASFWRFFFSKSQQLMHDYIESQKNSGTAACRRWET